MSFLNATLVLGALAAIVPVVLHLIARREPKKVVFPSITFLTRKFESNRSRMRVRRWWLLAMRIAAVAALAIALARPAIHQSMSVTWITIGLIAIAGIALLAMATVAVIHNRSRGMRYGLAASAAALIAGSLLWGVATMAIGPSVAENNNAPVAIAIVIDNSTTSGWKTANDDRMMKMTMAASKVAAQVPRGSRIAVIDRSATPAVFSLDVAGALSKLESIGPSDLPRPITSRLDAAIRLLRTSNIDNRQVLLLTDLAKSTWDESALQSSIAETLASSPPVSMTLVDTGPFVGVNDSLTQFSLSDPTPPAQSPVPISVTLRRNTFTASPSASDPASGNPAIGGSAVDDSLIGDSVTVEAQLFQSDPGLPVVRDGKVVYPPLVSVDRTTQTVAANGSSELLLTLAGLPVGTHHGRLRIVGEDPLAIDNQRYFSVSVLPPASVLIVSGNENAESKIISDAITASVVSGTDAIPEFNVEQMGFADIPVARLQDYQTVVLLDPTLQSLSDPALAQYVAGGGSMLVALGPQADPQTTGADARASIDALQSVAWLPRLVRRWRVPDAGTFFRVTDVAYPVTTMLDGDTPWNEFPVQQYWQLQPSADDRVLIRFSGTDHPAMLVRDVTDENSDVTGRVLVVATPLPALAKDTRDWNRLFGIDPWPAWLLTRQSIDFLTGRRGDQPMATVGQPHRIALSRPLEPGGSSNSDSVSEPETSLPSRLQLFEPGGSPPIPIDLSSQNTGQATTTEQSYVSDRSPRAAKSVSLATVDSAGVYWIKGGVPGLGFSANLADDAIDLERVERSDLDNVFGGPDQWSYRDGLDDVKLSDRQSAVRISLSSPAMLLALLVFLLEQVLGNRFYRNAGG